MRTAKITRRRFLGASGRVALGAGLFGPGFLGSTSAPPAPPRRQTPEAGYGPLSKDPKGILDLPAGFTYRIISRAGERMQDGFFVPGYPDGMGAFPGPDGSIILLRNHEIQSAFHPAFGPFGQTNELLGRARRSLVYDRGGDVEPALGSVTTLVYDPETGEVIRQALSLTGTLVNCSGGVTPWKSWLSCEEIFQNPNPRFHKKHGYVFEVPATAEPDLIEPVPLTAMGRFVHEAAAVDPRTGIVYMTEDQPDSLIYRFVPSEPTKLGAGGVLQCLGIAPSPRLDTRNWQTRTVSPGDFFETVWIDLDDVDTKKDDLRLRGFEAGAALFGSGEGMTFNEGTVYFDCTNGGRSGAGQVWKYLPSPYEGTGKEAASPGRLQLFVEVPSTSVIDHPDQMANAPWGDLLICEDGEDDQYLVGITPGGEIHRFARNARDESEFSGVCFSPDGGTMFVNLQNAGLTFAVTGPWKSKA